MRATSRSCGLAELICLMGLAGASLMGCLRPDSTPAISLIHQFPEAEVTGSPQTSAEYPRLEWRFDGETTIKVVPEPGPFEGWFAANDLTGVSDVVALLPHSTG